MVLEDDHYCFGCGSLNDSGLKLRFELEKGKKELITEFTPQKKYQGFKDIVHGGIIGLILDECMVNLLWKLGINAVSAEFTVRLIKPAYVGKNLFFKAKLVEEKKRLFIVNGECRNDNEELIATSISKCAKIDQEA